MAAASKHARVPLLPNDIIYLVFARLPVKSLMRFRCVSKGWREVISDPTFVRLHGYLSGTGRPLVFSISDDQRELFLNTMEEEEGEPYSRMRNPFFSEDAATGRRTTTTKILAPPCRGLVCLRVGRSDHRYYNVFVCNPSMWEFAYISSYSDVDRFTFCRDHVTYDLGFDAASGEYKLVRLICRYPWKEKWTECEVFTVAGGGGGGQGTFAATTAYPPFCRRMGKIPYTFEDRCAAFVNGALHWMTKAIEHEEFCSEAIVAFDLREEVFRTIKGRPSGQPSCLSDRNRHRNSCWLTELNDRLCLLDRRMSFRIDVWVLTDYCPAAGEGVWVEHCRVDMSLSVERFERYEIKPGSWVKYVHVLRVHEDGRVWVALNVKESETVWGKRTPAMEYDPKTERFRPIDRQLHTKSDNCHVCAESLASLRRGAGRKL